MRDLRDVRTASIVSAQVPSIQPIALKQPGSSSSYSAKRRPPLPPVPSRTQGPGRSDSVGAQSKTVKEIRTAIDTLQYPALDPFVTTMLGYMWASLHWQNASAPVTPSPGTPSVLKTLPLEKHFRHPLPINLNLAHGAHAPMLVILPGLNGDTSSTRVLALQEMAQQYGMNYVTLPVPWSLDWINSEPRHNPGILPYEAEVAYDALNVVKALYPQYFKHVSLLGFSYGAQWSMGLLKHQKDQGRLNPHAQPLINASVVNLSPPEALLDSTQEIDQLRHHIGGDYDIDWLDTPKYYEKVFAEYDFAHIMDSPLANRKNPTPEKHVIDRVGGRIDLMRAVPVIDARGPNLLPLNAALLEHGDDLDPQTENDLRDEQEDQVDAYTYAQYIAHYVAQDPWFAAHHTTIQAVNDTYRYSKLLDEVSGQGVAVMTVGAVDDYILNSANVSALRHHQTNPHPDQITRLFDHGGHLGMMYAPQIRAQLFQFLATPPKSTASVG
ncbi:MAG: hypothetical protein R3C68_08725 [Myxococcota bacterium]